MSYKLNLETDLLVIGGGPGGYVAAIYGAKMGLNVILVESGKLGGTCLNVGCIPTKTLVKSSELHKDLINAADFGIKVKGNIEVDMAAIIDRKDEIKDRLVSGIEFLMKKNKIKVLYGHGSFIDEDKVVVKGEEELVVAFKNVIIATGSKISNIKIPGIDLPCVMTSTDALKSKELPKSITIVGGGVIGMEFAFIYRNLGVEVHVIEYMDRLLAIVDKDLSRELLKTCRKAGIKVSTKSKVTSIEQLENGQALVNYQGRKGEESTKSDRVLIATGREPNLDNLGIENINLKLNDNGKGIAVDDTMVSNLKHVYAIGDVTNIYQLAHVASYQAMVAIDNIIGKERKVDYRAVPNVIFTSPEIASVGLNEEECKEKKIDYTASKSSYINNGKALAMGQNEGFVKLIKENASNKIIGCSIIGPDASALISTITLAISKGLTDEDLRQMIFVHPTTSEVILEAAQSLDFGAIHQ